MKAQIAFPSLLAAARALKPYTTPPRWHTGSRLLFLHAEGPILTLSATTGDQTAAVCLDGAVDDGWCALPPDRLIKALTVSKPAGRNATSAATVSLHGDDGRLSLTVADQPTLGLDTDRADGPPPSVAAQPAPSEQPVTTGPVADWYDLIAGVATAASHEPGQPQLTVVRLLRDHPGVVLMAEAIGRHRIHRGSWGEPDGEPVDIRMPTAATGPALRLLHTVDPSGHLHVHADDTHIYWRTDRVHLAPTTSTNAFPDLEKTREDVLADATNTITIGRANLLAALTTAQQLATTTRHPRLRLQPAEDGGLQVVLHADSGARTFSAHLAVARMTGQPPTLTLDPTFARDAIAFLDSDQVDLHATARRLPIYLAGRRRHAIVMQIST